MLPILVFFFFFGGGGGEGEGEGGGGGGRAGRGFLTIAIVCKSYSGICCRGSFFGSRPEFPRALGRGLTV